MDQLQIGDLPQQNKTKHNKMMYIFHRTHCVQNKTEQNDVLIL